MPSRRRRHRPAHTRIDETYPSETILDQQGPDLWRNSLWWLTAGGNAYASQIMFPQMAASSPPFCTAGQFFQQVTQGWSDADLHQAVSLVHGNPSQSADENTKDVDSASRPDVEQMFYYVPEEYFHNVMKHELCYYVPEEYFKNPECADAFQAEVKQPNHDKQLQNHIQSSASSHLAEGRQFASGSREPPCSSISPSFPLAQPARAEEIAKGLCLLDASLQERERSRQNRPLAQRCSAKQVQGVGKSLENLESSNLQTRAFPESSCLDPWSLYEGLGPTISLPSLVKFLNLDPLKAIVPQEKQWKQLMQPVQKPAENTKTVEDDVDRLSEASTVAEGMQAPGDDAECASVVEDAASAPEEGSTYGATCTLTENEKRLRNLQKKLRQIDVLEQRQLAGARLYKDAVIKLSRKTEIIGEISRLCNEKSNAPDIEVSSQLARASTDLFSESRDQKASALSDTGASQKELRCLEKKLRQIQMLEERQHQGNFLDTEATDKIARKGEIQRQIQDLREALDIRSGSQKQNLGHVDPSPETQDPTHCRNIMLKFRHLVSGTDISGLCTTAYLSHHIPDHKKQGNELVPKGSIDRSCFGVHMPITEDVEDPFFKLSKWYDQKPLTHEAEVERSARNLLNILCPENFERVLARFRNIQVSNLDELRIIVSLIHDKALYELHYCETYVKLIYCLEDVYQQFDPLPGSTSGRPQTFITLLKDKIQEVFERFLSLLQVTTPVDEASFKDLQHTQSEYEAQALANVKLIGELFLWKLLPFKLICQVGMELSQADAVASEKILECACMLLQAAGHTLDNDTPSGSELITAMLWCMDNQWTLCSKRLQTVIQDIKDARLQGWQRKLFRDVAKTKCAVRQDAEHEIVRAKVTREAFATRVMGARPAGVAELDAMKAAFHAGQDKALMAEVQDANKVCLKQGVGEEEEATNATHAPQFDLAFVKRTLSYFFEEQNLNELAREWQRAQAFERHGQVDHGAEWLLEIGSGSCNWDLCAQAILELASRELLPCHALQAALIHSVSGLHDLVHDCPEAMSFFETLLARLLLARGKAFFEQVFGSISPGCSERQQMREKLLWGILEELKRLDASEAVDYMLKMHVAADQ